MTPKTYPDVACPTVYPERRTWYAGMKPDDPGVVTYNVPCGGHLHPCGICGEQTYCGREGRCLRDDAATHVVRRHFEIDAFQYGMPNGVPGYTRG